MGNVFIVLDIGEMTETDWTCTKKLDKADKLIILIPENGLMPYKTVNHFYDMKNKPVLLPYADLEPVALSFVLGSQISDLSNGRLFIVSAENKWDSLNNFTLTQEKQIIEVRTLSSLSDAIAERKASGSRKPKSTTTASSETAPEISLEEEYSGISEASVKESQVPMKFIDLLQLYSTPGVNLIKYAPQIYESVQNTTEGVLSTLEFQLKIRLGEDTAKIVFPLLESHTNDLKEV